MRKSLMPILIFVLLVLVAGFPVTIGISETFDIPPLKTVNRIIELEKNDRLSVSFKISNNDSSVIISARVLDPDMKILLSFSNTRGDSFTYTAPKAGTYTIGFVYENDPLDGSINAPKIELNYDVAPTSSTPNSTSGGILDIWLELAIFALAIGGSTTIILLLRRSHKR